ncbi:macrophage mannose receptor 1-like [Lytechinus variegatus]|uniref:macrophage mannose receptor 1-like n=1 Tax=Lytechinus variegatus TaxID=7654 RepID=UPI001BB2AF49|nr:macrophage mannose receptor 1-like [Lytechinus variegatus]
MSKDVQACESGQSENGGSCYYFSGEKTSFSSSVSACEHLGMHLVYIGSQDEQTFLENSLKDTSEKHWIGLSPFTWMDHTHLTYNNFPENNIYTFNDGAICFRMSKGDSWIDTNCAHLHFFICEKETDSEACAENTQIKMEGSCYYFLGNESDFDSSATACEELGMHLVYIGSADEQKFLKENLPLGNQYWIGMAPVTWLDGSGLTYSNFADHKDTFKRNGTCFNIDPGKSYQWLDDDCSDGHSHRYICEKEEIQSTSTQQTTPITTSTPASTTLNTTTTHQTMSSRVPTSTNGSTKSSSTQFVVTSEAGQGSTHSFLSTDAIPETAATLTTEAAATGTCQSLVIGRDGGRKGYKKFQPLARNVALTVGYVLSSYTGSSLIECSQFCLADQRCSCYTFVAEEGVCQLGQDCPKLSIHAWKKQQGAIAYSELKEGRGCF